MQQEASGTSLTGKWTVAVLMMLVYTCHYIDRSILGIVLEEVKGEFTLTDAQLGLLAGPVYSVAFAITVIPVGLMADRVNRTRLLAIILILWSSATALCGIAVNWVHLLASWAVVGAAESGAAPTCMSIIASRFRPEERATATGIFFFSSPVGTILTFALGGTLVATIGWRWTFLLAGLPGMVLGLLLLSVLKDGQPQKRDVTAKGHHFQVGLAQIFAKERRPAFLNLLAGGAVSTAVVSGVWTWAAPFFIRSHGLSTAEAGFAVALGIGVGGGIGTLLSGRISDMLQKRRHGLLLLVPIVTSLGLAVFGVAFPAVSHATHAIALFVVWCILAAAFMSPVYSALLSIVPAAYRGLSVSIIQLTYNLVGYSAGAMIVGLASDRTASLPVGLGLLSLLSIWAAGHYAFALSAMQKATPGLSRSLSDA